MLLRLLLHTSFICLLRQRCHAVFMSSVLRPWTRLLKYVAEVESVFLYIHENCIRGFWICEDIICNISYLDILHDIHSTVSLEQAHCIVTDRHFQLRYNIWQTCLTSRNTLCAAVSLPAAGKALKYNGVRLKTEGWKKRKETFREVSGRRTERK